MKKLLLGLLLTCSVFTAQAKEESIGSWYLVNNTSAFTPALNTNSSALGVMHKGDKTFITLMSDFDECKPVNAEGQLINRTLYFSDDVVLNGMVQCREGSAKTDMWFPKGLTNTLLLNALLTGDKYVSVGSIVFATDGYSKVIEHITK